MRYRGIERTEESLRTREPVILPVKRQYNIGCPAHDASPLNRSEKSRVETVVTIIPHHKILTLGHRYGPEGPFGRNIRYRHYGMRMSGQYFGGKDAVLTFRFGQLTRYLSAQGRVINELPIEDELFVPQLDHIPRQADHTLDQACIILGRKEHDNVPTLWVRPLRQMPGGERNLQVKGQFVNENAIPLKDRRFHGTCRHVIPIRERGPDRKKNERQNKEGTNLLLPALEGAGTKCYLHSGFDQQMRSSFNGQPACSPLNASRYDVNLMARRWL